MIIIQAFLIIGFLAFLFRFLFNPSSFQVQAGIKILMIVLTALAIVVVLFPALSNDVAKFVGVTRGADLLLYCLALSFIFQSLNTYTSNKRLQKRIVLLARKIAIMEANQSKHASKSSNPRS